MKNKMKKKIIGILSLILICNMGTGLVVSAKETHIKAVEPRYVSTCPSGKKHYMVSKAWANVFQGVYPNGTLKWPNAPKYQCKYCHVLIITKTPVNGRDPIGEYTIWHPQEPVDTIITNFYTTNFYYESGKELSGYEFH